MIFCAITEPFNISFVGSLVYTKLVTSVHYCPATKKYIEKKYSDFTSLTPYPSGSVYPTKVI